MISNSCSPQPELATARYHHQCRSGRVSVVLSQKERDPAPLDGLVREDELLRSESLYAVVLCIGDVDIPSSIDRHVEGLIKLAGISAMSTPLRQRVTGGRKFLNALVA